MKQTKLDKITEYVLIIFLIVQPIFDLKIFYNSISTLIRVIIISFLFCYYFIKSENKKKYLFIIYPILLGIYFIFHHLNSLNFTSLVPGNFDYSILQEFLYFVKMVSPFLLIYVLFKANLDNKKYFGIMKCIVLFISLVIIITNILGISYGSYTDEKIKANLFSWFNTNYDYLDLASKGLFEYGNQIGAVLIMFLPFMFYCVVKSDNLKQKIINLLVLIADIFALILLSTRVSILGVCVVFIYTIFSFILIHILDKNNRFSIKKYVPIVAVFIIFISFLPVNPVFIRLNELETIKTFSETTNNAVTSNEISEPSENKVNQITETSEFLATANTETNNAKDIVNYIENNYEEKNLHPQFLFDYYPYKYDPEFWYEFLQNDITLTSDYRYIELSMVKRVVQINNNPMDKWLGITNTRLQNIFNIERDFVVQYYALGIIGAILVFAPYFIILGAFTYKTLKSKLKNLTLVNLLAFITIMLLFCISYFTGNLLNSLSFTIYFAMLFGMLIKKSDFTN